MSLRRCIEPGCTTLTRVTRCELHERLYRRGVQSHYIGPYRQARQAVLEAEPWCHTEPECPYPDRGTPMNPLTADHVVPIADGGSYDQLTVLCRRCNSSKGARPLASAGR